MHWNERLELLRWRAVEEADADGVLLPHAERAEATRYAARESHFLHDRLIHLSRHATTKLRDVFAAMHVPSITGWAWVAWIIALALGYGFAELGTSPHEANINDASLQGRLINVLALPLMSILLWNAAMIVSSLIMEWRAASTTTGLPRLLRDRLLRPSTTTSDLTHRIVTRFHQRVDPLLAAHLTSRARAWLHIGAAALAMGAIAGMYAKGWSREYRAVWESTVLDQNTATRLLSALYRPASAVTGVEVPLRQMEVMRAGPGRMPQPQNALPWIHLYAGTLLLLVILPRLALAALTLWRGNQRVALAWSKLDWPGHVARLKSAVSGSGLVVDVLSLGWRPGEEPRDRWSTCLREHLGALALLQFHFVPPDDSDAFVSDWTSAATSSVLVFNAATTPEMEVHVALAQDLRDRLRATNETARLIMLLDATTLSERRSADAVKTRLELWQSLLAQSVDSVLVCGRAH